MATARRVKLILCSMAKIRIAEYQASYLTIEVSRNRCHGEFF
jgi:hypothetical protein